MSDELLYGGSGLRWCSSALGSAAEERSMFVGTCGNTLHHKPNSPQ